MEATFHSARHTGVTLEPRSILADYNRGSAKLTVYHATQAPHMMQGVFAKHLRMPEGDVRVICSDIGGSYGIKVHVYPDEVATAVIAKIMARPVKFIADRLESFATDIHARDHRITARMAVDAEGRITAIDVDDLTGIGPYSVYPRTSAVEGNQVVNLVGGPTTSPTSAPRPRSSSRTRRRPASTARWATQSPRPSPRAWSISPPRRWGSTPSSSAAAT